MNAPSWSSGRTPDEVIERAGSEVYRYRWLGPSVHVDVRPAALYDAEALIRPPALPSFLASAVLNVGAALPHGAVLACGTMRGGFSTSYAWFVLGRGQVIALSTRSEASPKVVDVAGDGSMCLLVGAGQRLVAVFADGTERVLPVTDRPAHRRVLSPDGARLCTTERGGVVRAWDTRSGTETTTPQRPSG
jgi:hypothetical protein